MIRLIKHGVKRLTGTDEPVDVMGISEFLETLQRGDEKTAMELFRGGADIFRVTLTGADALIFAAQGGNNRLLQFLLDQGVKPGARDRQNRTAVSICCEKGNFEGLLLLYQGGATLATTDEERDGLLIDRGVWGKNPDLVAFLLKEGIEPDYLSWEGFRTPLTLVVYWNHLELAKVLLNGGANANSQGKTGDSPLFGAHQRSNPVMIDVLLKHGADPLRLPGPCHLCGQTFFHGDYQMGQSDFGDVDWRCSWCGRPTCSDCAGGRFGQAGDHEHKICRPCLAAQNLLPERVEHGIETIWRWAHRRENVGQPRMTFRCPSCHQRSDLALTVNTFPRCIFHGHLCPDCLPDPESCPVCARSRR